ncbi:gonadotropin-releasing hormone receptor-like isoform X2 [Varroa destructor]|uniref:G-protein coupled receptors family 1 profile domain-containing protein n=2 Tax=Varroa TaxID=62624 RepID=A0A7M7KI75_VARDE|nr:gonadotropin-releasing hormone receptor-like isoform X2 [Varroa destructor]
MPLGMINCTGAAVAASPAASFGGAGEILGENSLTLGTSNTSAPSLGAEVMQNLLANNMTLNGTVCNEIPRAAPAFTTAVLLRACVLSVIAALSLVSNVATLVSISRVNQHVRSSLYSLLANMAVADLLVTVFCIVAEAAWTATVAWLADEVTCKGLKYMQVFSLYLSTFVLVLLAFDQYLAVTYPMRRDKNRRLIRQLVVFIWFLAGSLAIPQVFVFRVLRGPFIEEFYQCVTYGFYSAKWQEQLYTGVSFVTMFCVPLCFLIAIYACTFVTISRTQGGVLLLARGSGVGCSVSATSSSLTMEQQRKRLFNRAKRKSLLITLVIVAAFVVCWTPYYMMMVIFVFLAPDDQQLTEELSAAIFFFGSSTALINPLIYGVFHLRRNRRGPVRGVLRTVASQGFSERDADSRVTTASSRKMQRDPASSNSLRRNNGTDTQINSGKK